MQNIFNTSKPVTGYHHPLIANMYLKKDYSHNEEDVLVIEARRSAKYKDNSNRDFDSYLNELLINLDDVRKAAEAKVGHFDRIDIRAA